MAKKGENILTRKQVEELGFDKLSIITADMLEGYTYIGDHAFENCRSLASVVIPNRVISIGAYSFMCCVSLTSVTIGNRVTHIGEAAFAGCNNLESIEIPDSVTSIGYTAFYCCRSLTSVVIPNSVISIRGSAFSGCSNLTSVTIGNSVTSIGSLVFRGCNFEKKDRIDNHGRIIAYKGFNSNMTCIGFQYKEGETYEIGDKPILCEQGFHACLNPLDCLNYYWGRIGEGVVFHEVYLEDLSNEKSDDSKVVARKITIGREITLSEMADIASGRR